MSQTRLNEAALLEAFGMESIDGAVSHKVSKKTIGTDGNIYSNMLKVKRYGVEDLQTICSLLRKEKHSLPDSVLFDVKQYRMADHVLGTEAINRVIDNLLEKPKAYDQLPETVKKITSVVKAEYDRQLEKYMGAESTSIEKQVAGYKLGIAKSTLKDMLFNGFASVMNDAIAGRINLGNGTYNTYGTEALQAGSAYAIHYPFLEYHAQWVNASGSIWSKLVKSMNMLSVESSMPIEQKKQVFIFRDATGKPVKEINREDYYRFMDMDLLKDKGFLDSNIDIFRKLSKDLVIPAAQFNKTLKLVENIPGGSDAILQPYQQAAFQFELKEVLLNGETSGAPTNKFQGTIYDMDGTPMKGTVLSEIHYNGRVLFLVPNPSTAPEKKIALTIYFDPKQNTFFVSQAQVAGETATIDKITFIAKILDLPSIEKVNSSYEVRTHKVVITPGEQILREINFNPEYNAYLESRAGAGKIVENEINARTEELNNIAESIFVQGYNAMSKQAEAKAKEEAARGIQPFTLWAHANVDLKEAQAVNKTENYNIKIARTFQRLITAYSQAGNTQAVGMNIWCNVASLQPLYSAMMPIIGTVAADNTGDFLGTVSPVEAHVFTAGTNNGPSPVKAVIVGTNKSDLMPDMTAARNAAVAKHGANPTADQVSAEVLYKYNIVPLFGDPNMDTIFMSRVALSMTDSSMGYRSATNGNVPHIQMKTAFKLHVVREGGGRFSLNGYNAAVINDWA